MDRIRSSGRQLGLGCFQCKERAHIRALEYQLTSKQKQFGVAYLDLVERQAGQQALQTCLRTSMKEISQLQKEIDVHLDAMEQRKQ